MPRIEIAKAKVFSDILKEYESHKDSLRCLEAMYEFFHPVVVKTPETEMLEMLHKIDEKIPELQPGALFKARDIAEISGVNPTHSDLRRIREHLNESSLLDHNGATPGGYTKRIANGTKPPAKK